jgi:hypothetical protein
MAKRKEWNFIESDGKDMTPTDKGEILYHHKMGRKPKEIAGLTGRSMEWIKIIVGGLASWKSQNKLINLYINKLCKEEQQGAKAIKTEKKAIHNVSSGTGSRPNKTSTAKRNTKQVSTHRTKRRRTKGDKPGSQSSRSKNTDKQGLADNLRKAKDYKGE